MFPPSDRDIVPKDVRYDVFPMSNSVLQDVLLALNFGACDVLCSAPNHVLCAVRLPLAAGPTGTLASLTVLMSATCPL